MFSRRRFVRGVGSLVATGALAGCSAPSGGNGGGDTETAAGTPTTSGGGGGNGNGNGGADDGGGGPSSVSGWLSDVGNFDGSIADLTGQSEATVRVGAEGNGGNFAFAPPAIRVDAGTTVVWEWTGEGGQHNVVAESGADFATDLAIEAGHTFSRTFDAAGVITYYCRPHRSLGMKGAVVVVA